jgi:hypothetical protein
MDREAGVSPPAARERVPERVAPASLAKWGPVHALCSTRNGVGNGAVSRWASIRVEVGVASLAAEKV